jgi:hypothetical protein
VFQEVCKLLLTFTAVEETCRFSYRQLPSSSIRQLHFRSSAEIIRLVSSHYGDEGKSSYIEIDLQ